MPGGAWAVKVVAGQPVFKVPMSVSATDVPASTRYDVGATPPAAGAHVSVTSEPLTVYCSADGGAAVHDGPTVRVTSLDGGLVPAALCALTRTKYTPAGTSIAVNVVSVLPVEKCARLLHPLALPAAMTYTVGAPPLSGGPHVSVTFERLTDAAS